MPWSLLANAALVSIFRRNFRSTLIQGDSIVSTLSQAQEVVN